MNTLDDFPVLSTVALILVIKLYLYSSAVIIVMYSKINFIIATALNLPINLMPTFGLSFGFLIHKLAVSYC